MIQLPFQLATIFVDDNGKVTCSVNCGPNNLLDFIPNAIKILMFAIGTISIIMVLVGGLRYVLSGGNPQATKQAKDTILYAVIGLIVALLATAIITFVTGRFGI
jgi:hypothetical protein